MRLRLLLPVALVVILAAALLSSCGGGPSGAAPSTAELVRSSALAVGAQKDVKVHYKLDATLTARPSAAADAQTRTLLAKPIALKLEGGVSETALTAKGTATLAGKSYDAQALVGQAETFVNLMGVWYGDRTQGLGDMARERPTDPAATARKLAQAGNIVDRILDAKVAAGPNIDGDTWEADGRLDVDGIIVLAGEANETLTAEQRAQLEAFAKAARVRYAIGADDRLPRRLSIALDLDSAQLAELSDDPSAAQQLDALELELTAELTDWGEDVRYEAPADVRPMEELGGALMGMFFSLAAGAQP